VSKVDVAVMFRWPQLPVIVVGPGRLTAALDRKKLLGVLGALVPTDGNWEVKIIDITGREFWYDSAHHILAPGIGARVWTKSRIVQLYNQSRKPGQRLYLPGSLPNRRLERIVREITRILNAADPETRRPARPIGRPPDRSTEVAG
jgi:hypothetical protein